MCEKSKTECQSQVDEEKASVALSRYSVFCKVSYIYVICKSTKMEWNVKIASKSKKRKLLIPQLSVKNDHR